MMWKIEIFSYDRGKPIILKKDNKKNRLLVSFFVIRKINGKVKLKTDVECNACFKSIFVVVIIIIERSKQKKNFIKALKTLKTRF